MKTTFHADDIGMTARITETIVEAWKAGLLEGFSVLANGAAVEDVGRALAAEPRREARIYAHLNLYEGMSISPRGTVPLITDPEGNLNCRWGALLVGWLLRGPRWRQELQSQVEREWRAQLEKVREVCAPRHVTGVDGHVHMHMLPFLFPIAARLANSFGIGDIRISSERFHRSGDRSDMLRPGFVINLLKHGLLNACAVAAKPVATANGLAYPSGVLGVLYSGRMSQSAVSAGVRASKRAGLKSLQVIFHIGRADAEEMAFWRARPAAGSFSMSRARDAEYRALRELRRDG